MEKSFFKCTCCAPDCIFEKAVDERWLLSRKMYISIYDLEISFPAINCCKTVGILLVQDLVLKSEEELSHDGFSHQLIGEIKTALKKLDLKMGMKLPK